MILAGGMVLWWFVRDQRGVRMIGGLIGDAIAFVAILLGQPMPGFVTPGAAGSDIALSNLPTNL